MNIVVIGCGTVGSAICEQLTNEGHDVTVIDESEAAVNALTGVCDVFSVVGSGANVSLLKKCGASDADLIIAVTSSDEVNILCCAAARKLGAKHSVARVRNPEYGELMLLMKEDMNLSLTIIPELHAAKAIYRVLSFPSAAKIDTFCHGRVELAEFTLSSESPICGMSLNALRSKLNIKFLVCSVLRNGQAYIPSGDFVVMAGDVLGVTAPDDAISPFFKAIGMYKQPVKNILTVGGGRITYYLQSLLKKRGIRNTVIESDKELCRELAEEYKDLTVLCDSSTNQELLLEEGIESADAFLALSSEDAENAITSIYAKNRGVPKIITVINTLSYLDYLKDIGLESVISPKTTTAAFVVRYVRAMANSGDSEIESLHKMMNDTIEAVEFRIKEDIPGITGVKLAELRPKSGVLVACIVRDNNVIIPSGGDSIAKDDTVVVITTAGVKLQSIKEIV